jgi:hypothetical protein
MGPGTTVTVTAGRRAKNCRWVVCQIVRVRAKREG